MDSLNRVDRHLRREAERTRPTFSEALHARLGNAVFESPRGEPPRRHRHWTAAVSAIAAAAVAMCLLLWQSARRPLAEKDGPDASPTPEAAVAVPPSTVKEWLGGDDLLGVSDRLSEVLAMTFSDNPWSPAAEKAQAAVFSRVPISGALLEELMFERAESDKETPRIDN